MRLIQGLFLFYIILTINILNAEGDLKFDAQGNIIDDGLNLNIPSLPKDLKDQKKSKPLGSAKSNRLLPKSDRVMADSAAKGLLYLFYVYLTLQIIFTIRKWDSKTIYSNTILF